MIYFQIGFDSWLFILRPILLFYELQLLHQRFQMEFEMYLLKSYTFNICNFSNKTFYNYCKIWFHLSYKAIREIVLCCANFYELCMIAFFTDFTFEIYLKIKSLKLYLVKLRNKHFLLFNNLFDFYFNIFNLKVETKLVIKRVESVFFQV